MRRITDCSAHKGLPTGHSTRPEDPTNQQLAHQYLAHQQDIRRQDVPQLDPQERVILCRGNRTEVARVLLAGEQIVEKRLLSFADVSTERVALYREAALQKAVQGPGVVSIVDERVRGVENLAELADCKSELNSIHRNFVDGYSLQDLIERPQLHEMSGRSQTNRCFHKSLCSHNNRCALWIRSLALTLARVHDFRAPNGNAFGLVHRDVTPGNILIERAALERPPGEEGVWLNDFGLAHIATWGPLLPEETLQGASRYLSPELRAGQSPSAASDIYQAALILCALLCSLERTPLEALFNPAGSPLEGLSLSEHAYRLLAPWRAESALDSHPENRPTALELASLLAS